MSSSLPVTPTTPITYWRPRIMPIGVDHPALSQSLSTFLSSSDSPQEVEGALTEFFFRSLVSGRRVREWCDDVRRVAESVRDPTLVHTALHSSLLSLAFPFHPCYPGGTVTSLPPLVPPSTLSTLSRKQLVDGLVRLSRRLAIPSLAVDGWQETVIELCVEYVGRRWRLALEKHETDLLGGIGLKLLEVEFDLQLRGHPSTSRPLILPILQRFPFDLGLVTASQLVTRLNSPRHHIPSASSLVYTWLSTHLRAGEVPQALIDELVSTYDKLTNPSHREQMITTASSFGLRFDQADEAPPPAHSKPMPHSPSRIPRRFSLRNKSFGLTSPKWLTHRRHDSSSKLSGIFPSSFNPDRRPSLPNVSTTSLLHPISRTKLSVGPESPKTPATIGHSHLSHTRALFSSPDLLASTLSLIDASTLRPALVNQLLSMKYHLSPDPSDDWYLGEGRVVAQRLITDIEDQLLSTQTQVEDIAELRRIFHLPRETTEYPSELEHLLSGEFGNFPVPPPRLSMSSTVDARSRTTSFDLDRYFEGISEAGDEDESPKTEDQPTQNDEGRQSMEMLLPSPSRRSSAGLESLLTVATGKTGATAVSRGRRSSSHTSFTIQKATRGWTGYPAQLVKPRRVRSIDERASGRGTGTPGRDDFISLDGEDDGSDHEDSQRGDSDLEELDDMPALGSYLPPRSNRWSRSEADLIFPRSPPSAEDLYTRLPTVNSLRRRKRMQKPSLSAIDLGLGRQVLTPPGFPQSPPPTEDDLATPTASSFAPTGRRCSAGPVSFFSPLDAPSIRDARALIPEGYVAPLTPPTSPPQHELDLGPDTPRASSSSSEVVQSMQTQLAWSPPWGRNTQTTGPQSNQDDDATPRIKRQINRQYRILDGDLSPEKRPSDLDNTSALLPVIREDPPSPEYTAPTRISPHDSPQSEDWFTAPETPQPFTGLLSSNLETASSQPALTLTSSPSLGLPVPPPRSSSLRRLRPSTSQKSLSGVTTWSAPSYNPHSPSVTPAPLDIDGIATSPNEFSLGSPFQSSTARESQRSSTSASWASSDDSSSIKVSESVNPLKSILGLFLDPTERYALHPIVTEGHIRYVLHEILKREMEEDEREHIKWLITKAADLIDDPRWHCQVGPYLAIWNPIIPSTPESTFDLGILPDLTPRNLSPPKSHPLLSSMPGPRSISPSNLPWSASSPNLLQHAPSPRSTLMASTSTTSSATSTLTGPEASLLGNNSGQAGLIVKRRMNKFRLSISTFGRRDSYTSSSSPSSTKSQTLYEALRG